MNTNDKVAVYYIATDDYESYSRIFLESVHDVFLNRQKIVKNVSNGLDEYFNYEKLK